MSMFEFSKDELANKKTIEEEVAERSNFKPFLNKSGVYEVTVSDAKIQSWGSKDKALSMTLSVDGFEDVKFVNINFINKEGEINEKNLSIIKSMVANLKGKTKFNGENPEVFDGLVVEMAIKALPKTSGKSAGYPMFFINEIFNKKGLTEKEVFDKETRTRTKNYYLTEYEKDEPIVVSKKAKTNKSMTVEERIAANGGEINSAETPVFDDTDDEDIFPF